MARLWYVADQAAMTRESKRRILIRALGIVGDRDQLASRLGVRRAEVDAWLENAAELPDELYLKATDVCLDHDAPSLWDQRADDQPPRSAE